MLLQYSRRASSYCPRTLNQGGLGTCTKVPSKWRLINLQFFFIIHEILFSTTSYTSLRYMRYTRNFQTRALLMTLQLYSQLNLSFPYLYFSSAYTDLTSHKETLMYYVKHEFLAWTFFPWNNSRMTYCWTLQFIQMLVHLHTLKANTQSQRIFPFFAGYQCLHMLHKKRRNEDIKQWDRICPSFLTNKICNGPSPSSILTSHYLWIPATTQFV